MKYTEFNKEAFYNEEIEKKIIELKQLCNRENLPFFVAVCVKNDKNETEYKKDMLTAQICEVELKDDIIPKLVNVTLGFDIIQPTTIPEIEYD